MTASDFSWQYSYTKDGLFFFFRSEGSNLLVELIWGQIGSDPTDQYGPELDFRPVTPAVLSMVTVIRY